MRKSAVDYLFEKLWGIHKDKFTWQMILKEAKEKEKKQIKDAYIIGGNDLDIQSLENIREKNSEEYYQENYGKDA
jgi:hypothetical protein